MKFKVREEIREVGIYIEELVIEKVSLFIVIVGKIVVGGWVDVGGLVDLVMGRCDSWYFFVFLVKWEVRKLVEVEVGEGVIVGLRREERKYKIDILKVEE